MIIKICMGIKEKVTFKMLLICTALFAVMYALMRHGASHLLRLSEPLGILDLHFGYGMDTVKQLMEDLGEAGRSYYKDTFYLYDTFYPIAYMLFYTLSLAYMLKKLEIKKAILHLVIVLPVLGMIFDWLENLSIRQILLDYPAISKALLSLSNTATIMKFLLAYTSAAFLIVSLILYPFINKINKVKKMHIQYPFNKEIPVSVHTNLVYKKTRKKSLTMDIYLPKDIDKPLPVIFLVHGEGLEFFVRDAKNWIFYEDYGHLLASRGYAAVMFNHRSVFAKWDKVKEASEDVQEAIHYVTANHTAYHIDTGRMCVWTFSMGGIYTGPLLNRDSFPLSCFVSYYGLLDMGEVLKSKPYQEYYKLFTAANYLKTAKQIPVLIIDAKNDKVKGIRKAIKKFTDAADSLHFPYQYLLHQTGRHAFDGLDDNEETVEVIDKTLDFIKQHLVLCKD